MRFAALALGAVLTAACAAATLPASAADADRVPFPKDYKNFTRISTIDHMPTKRIRTIYVNPDAAKAAKPDQPAPDGTVLVMEQIGAKLDSAGMPELDADGRFIPDGKVAAIAVQMKKAGWGEGKTAGMKNGDWDYAAFKADGTINPDVKYGSCYACHLPRAAHDYTFVYGPWASTLKK